MQQVLIFLALDLELDDENDFFENDPLSKLTDLLAYYTHLRDQLTSYLMSARSPQVTIYLVSNS